MNIFKMTALIVPLGLAACDQGQKMTADDLMEIEREFAQYSKDHGYYEAFATYLSKDAVALNGGTQPAVGLEAVLANMEGGTGELLWAPIAADISESGDLGYTWGRYTFTSIDEDGQTQTSHGKYMSVWKLQADGSWKVVLDGGISNPPPEPN